MQRQSGVVYVTWTDICDPDCNNIYSNRYEPGIGWQTETLHGVGTDAQILIDTASGISSAIAGATAAAAAAGPAAPVVTPLLIAQMVGQVLAGVASAKAILKKVPGGGDSGGDENVNIPGGTSVGGIGGLVPNLEAISPPEISQQPVQAFVVENDISNSQALQEELEIQATL